MAQLQIVKAHNLSLLHEELLVAFPQWVGVRGPDGWLVSPLTLSSLGNEITLDWTDSTPVASVRAVVLAHNASGQSVGEKATARRAQARTAYKQLAALRGMTPDQAEAWVQTNVTDLASAKAALKLMARLLVILARVGDLDD